MGVDMVRLERTATVVKHTHTPTYEHISREVSGLIIGLQELVQEGYKYQWTSQNPSWEEKSPRVDSSVKIPEV